MDARLFSSLSQGSGLSQIVQACDEVLHHKPEANIMCMTQGMLASGGWLQEAQGAFRGVGRLHVMDTETLSLVEMQAALRSADLLLVADGNAYLLNHRLNAARIVPHLRKKIHNGLPVVAWGAGAVLCGPNVLTAQDLNPIPTTHFDGLGLTGLSVHVNYVEDVERDLWLHDYHSFHDNPVILMEAEACVRIRGRVTTLEHGPAWILRAGHEKETLKTGKTIPLV